MREDFKGVFWTMHEGVLSLSREFLGKLIRNKMFEEKARYGGIYSRWYGSKGLFEGPLLAVLCYFFGFRAVNLSSMRIGYRLEMLHEIPYEMFREIGVRAIHPLKPSKSADDLAFKVRSYFKNCREKDRAANRGQ
jgi:hypothetical protein